MLQDIDTNPEHDAGDDRTDESLTEHLLNRMAILAEQHVFNNIPHIRRVSLFSYQIAIHLGLDQQTALTIAAAARVHDIGMIRVPETILKKPGPLTKSEQHILQGHVAAGLRLIGRKRDPLIQAGRMVIAGHHERHDGSGYPEGLAGDAIPVEGRIVAVADTFDALCSPRPYRRHTDPETAVSIIINGGAGVHFAPEVVNAFAASRQQVLEVCARLPHR